MNVLLTCLWIFFIGFLNAQPPHSIYFSETEQRVLFLHSNQLNITKPAVWISYGLGQGNIQDTFAIARDSIFKVTYNGSPPRSDCSVFADENGKSFFCVLASYPLSEYLTNHALIQEVQLKPTPEILSVSLNENDKSSTQNACGQYYDKFSGNVEVSLVRTNDSRLLAKSPYDFDNDVLLEMDLRNGILDAVQIENMESPLSYRYLGMAFITGTYSCTSFKGKMCYDDPKAGCNCTSGSATRLIKVRHLRLLP